MFLRQGQVAVVLVVRRAQKVHRLRKNGDDIHHHRRRFKRGLDHGQIIVIKERGRVSLAHKALGDIIEGGLV